MDALLLQPGELRHKVQILAPSVGTPDAFGETDATWTFVLDTWARIRTLFVRELASTTDLSAQATHEIGIRYPSGINIDASMRIQHVNHSYKIQGIDNVLERNLTLLIRVLEIDGSE